MYVPRKPRSSELVSDNSAALYYLAIAGIFGSRATFPNIYRPLLDRPRQKDMDVTSVPPSWYKSIMDQEVSHNQPHVVF